jgi:hypothetical protein
MSKQQRSLRLFCTLRNVFEQLGSHGQTIASGLGRGHAHLWLSSSMVPAVRASHLSHPAQHEAITLHNTSCCDLLHAVAAGAAVGQQAASSRLQQLQQAGRHCCCYCCMVWPSSPAVNVHSSHRCRCCSKGRWCSSSCCCEPGEGPCTAASAAQLLLYGALQLYGHTMHEAAPASQETH